MAATYALNKARRRGYTVDLTIEDLVNQLDFQESRCAYTGLPMHLPTSRKSCGDPRLCASLDRIDSSLPYVKGNIQ